MINTKLGFEITESLEADDFGTGYLNIEHITKLPIDIIKFDKSLIIASGKDDISNFIIDSLSNMFDIVGYSILYEGI